MLIIYPSTLLANLGFTKTTSLNDRLDLAFFERYKGEFVEGRACFVKDSLSY
ncbi:hypothetical protein M096_4369 [Parabacteroides distasonis str. 3999B T(B) 6]|nr:hypothetical protein M095_3372 [Parabacteroides distasonis str. 3999B T(B) 4]KDS66411.1 hypothetical protein M096_4369 [Parabacteroides distasonis str. 3999B T(B) 6]